MITLTFAGQMLERLRSNIWDPEVESAAILLCSPVPMRGAPGDWRLLVVEVHCATASDYDARGPVRAQLSSSFCLPLETRAKREGWSLVYVHTHPREASAKFSETDDATEAALAAYLQLRCPGRPHGSLLLSQAAAAARVIGGDSAPIQIHQVGAQIRYLNAEVGQALEDRFDRQVRAFGPEGQQRLAGLRVAIVGLGGTGSAVAQQLAHLGVKRFILVDDDVIEETNLNRVVGAVPADVGVSKKVEVARRLVESLGSQAECFDAEIGSREVLRRVVEADFIFNCTDTHASRHFLNQASYQYLVPLIDMGVSITVSEGYQAQFSGHVKMLAPDLGCLWCSKNIHPEQLRRELMTDAQRAAAPYVQGAPGEVRQPAVISLNGVVVSLGVTMLLAAVAGVPSPHRFLYYDGNRARVSPMSESPDLECVFCGCKSTLALGDGAPVPGRSA